MWARNTAVRDKFILLTQKIRLIIMTTTSTLQTALKSPRTKKYGLRLLLAVVLVGVLGFFVLPPIVKSVMLDKLGAALHRSVSVNRVSINPYALTIQLDGVAIQEKDGGGTFASFDSLFLNLQSSSIFRLGAVLDEIRLVNPKLRIVRLADNRYNFSDLLDEFMAKPKSNDPTPAFSLNNIQLTGGTIEFEDKPVDEKHVVSDINLTIPFLSSMAYATDSFVEPLFSAHINGAPLVIKGKSKPFADTLESEVSLELNDLPLGHFIDYSPIKLPIKVMSGALDSTLKLVFHQEKDKPSTLLLSGSATVKGLDVKETSGAPLLSFKTLKVGIGSADLLNQKFVIDRFSLDTPVIDARVSAQGTVNWIEFAKAVPASTNKESPTAPAPLEWSLGEAKLTGGSLRWLDESNKKPFKASIDAIDFDLKNLTSKGEEPAAFNLAWRVTAEDWLKIDTFSIEGGLLDLNKREVSIENVLAKGVRGQMRRLPDGRIEWLEPPAMHAVEASQKDPSAPWKVTVAHYVGEDIAARFEDRAVSPVATHTVDGLGFEASNLSTEPGQTAKVATHFKLNRKGDIAVEGTVKVFPLSADLNLDVKSLELLPFQTYFTDKLNIAVTKGQLALSGAVQLRQGEADQSGNPGAFAGGFSGQATLGDFYAVDKSNSADFLRWKSFYVGKVDARLNPDSVSISDVALSDFFARVIVSPEGKLNLMQIVRKEDAAPTTLVPSPAEQPAKAAQVEKPVEGKANVPVVPVVAESKPMMPVKIGKITLQGGTVRFTDNFVKPNYTANLKEIGGRITGLSSEPGSVAHLELRGSYDNVAPLNITAQINPLSAKPYLDLQAEIKGMELTSFSSYSAKYAGYAIEKGKLSLFVKYKIENDQLQAENRIFLDQLTFGEPVESADATKLPVRLAVSLLKNRKGEIDINLPISGSLNDPEFSVGGLVIKVIVNLFVKAVTSPFALIGSLFGDGEELSMVEFDDGRSTITPEAQKRLENLAKALVDRPGLNLEVGGRVDVERDREGLKTASIDRKVRAIRREELTKNGVESGSAETVDVKPEEYPSLLERAYKAEKFPKPRNVVGLVKSLPVEEMQKLMLANATVDDDDLRGLADRRAKAVRDWLVGREVSAERIFLVPGKLGEEAGKPATDQKAKGSRVDFTLK